MIALAVVIGVAMLIALAFEIHGKRRLALEAIHAAYWILILLGVVLGRTYAWIAVVMVAAVIVLRPTCGLCPLSLAENRASPDADDDGRHPSRITRTFMKALGLSHDGMTYLMRIVAVCIAFVLFWRCCTWP